MSCSSLCAGAGRGAAGPVLHQCRTEQRHVIDRPDAFRRAGQRLLHLVRQVGQIAVAEVEILGLPAARPLSSRHLSC